MHNLNMNQTQSHQIQSNLQQDSHHIQHHHPTLCLINDSDKVSSNGMDKGELNSNLSSKSESIIKMKKNAEINIKSNKRILSPAFISLILIIHVISNQSFISSILEAGKGFTFVSSDDLSKFDNLIDSSRRVSNSGLINFVAADPAPLPASSSNSRASTARSNRGPPINGSMFGKRSVNNLIHSSSSTPSITSTSKQTDIDNIKAKNKQNKLNSQQSSPAIRLHSVNSYHDIVTEIIENFLASNNDNDPEEASFGFCRMIVFECQQMLNSRDKALARRRKRLPINLSAEMSNDIV